jgi:hypothetical protein
MMPATGGDENQRVDDLPLLSPQNSFRDGDQFDWWLRRL